MLRSDSAAWVALFLAAFASHWWDFLYWQSWWRDAAPWGAALVAGAIAGGFVLSTARWGLLAGITFHAVWIAVSKTPLTSDLSRWYAWRAAALVLLIAALAFWGFRNVLGRQSAFPAGTLDD